MHAYVFVRVCACVYMRMCVCERKRVLYVCVSWCAYEYVSDYVYVCVYVCKRVLYVCAVCACMCVFV